MVKIVCGFFENFSDMTENSQLFCSVSELPTIMHALLAPAFKRGLLSEAKLGEFGTMFFAPPAPLRGHPPRERGGQGSVGPSPTREG